LATEQRRGRPAAGCTCLRARSRVGSVRSNGERRSIQLPGRSSCLSGITPPRCSHCSAHSRCLTNRLRLAPPTSSPNARSRSACPTPDTGALAFWISGAPRARGKACRHLQTARRADRVRPQSRRRVRSQPASRGLKSLAPCRPRRRVRDGGRHKKAHIGMAEDYDRVGRRGTCRPSAEIASQSGSK
jgi:hypothetical protein